MFPNWAWRRQGGAAFAPENIDPSLCTHVIYEYAVLDPNELTLVSFDEWTDFDNSEYRSDVATRVLVRKLTDGMA